MRESLFQHLSPRLPGARFLDLFAGSGLMGFEALSRGAASVLAIENNPVHVRLIRQTMADLGLTPAQYEVRCRDAFRLAKKPLATVADAPFDLIFLDPPYALTDLNALIHALLAQGWLAPEGLLLLEQSRHAVPLALPDASYGLTTRSYGGTQLHRVTRLDPP